MVRTIGPEDRAQHPRAPRAHEAGQAHDLPRPHVKRNLVEPAPPAEPPHFEHGLARGPLVARRVDRGQLPPRHGEDQRIVAGLGQGDRRDDDAVPQHGDAVGEGAQLLQPVRDVDDRRASLPQPAQGEEE
jgi:hypothetical protein